MPPAEIHLYGPGRLELPLVAFADDDLWPAPGAGEGAHQEEPREGDGEAREVTDAGPAFAFLTVEDVLSLHEDAINTWGGTHGIS